MVNQVKKRLKDIDRSERQGKVFEMVKVGKTYREIADELDMSRKTVSSDFKTVITNLKGNDNKIQEWRILICHRLDWMLTALTSQIEKGDPEAIRAALKIEERRAKMLGIDKPNKLDITHHIPTLDPEEAVARRNRLLEETGYTDISTKPPIKALPAPSNGNGEAS